MSEILFLAHRVPFPPDRGDKIRSHHVLKRLAELGPVHVAAFGESDDDMAQDEALAAVAASHCLIRRDKPLWKAGLEALKNHEPVSIAAWRDERLAQWVAETLASRPISAIYVFSGQMGQYVPDHFDGRVVLDLVDVDSAKFEAYAHDKRWPLSRLYAREGALLKQAEARMAARAEVTLLVSDEEAALFRTRCASGTNVRALSNGIDSAFFDPGKAALHPELAAAYGPHFVFTGQMDYPPNIAAAKRVAEKLLPAFREVHPEAQFHIVGRAPPPSLTKLDGKDGVRVWGAVPDVRPFLAGADIVIVPLAIARGVQNKVLEAMAMARPVLATSGAATGIGAEHDRHLIVADRDRALIAEALTLLSQRERGVVLGHSAREFVLDHKSWRAMLAELPELVGFGTSPGSARDAA
jgi:sugar transferase (PEP-CTERM/EpsH1 system associated)